MFIIYFHYNIAAFPFLPGGYPLHKCNILMECFSIMNSSSYNKSINDNLKAMEGISMCGEPALALKYPISAAAHACFASFVICYPSNIHFRAGCNVHFLGG